ncbi:putative DNA-binding transcriptional regulator YafY [Nonomuraea jabiensis]|uniref:Putative DNA-binding transcriptional regulator YafY n=1 Tax=Nonomuraea jabiensis TaxID=882448 RepID=A0A7W9GKA0_9ACTN|nr:putative DNA-binding transcriptional regulator YafY [Nonomuraea jabiensis]
MHTPRRWYLVAWDAGREDWRTFRVDRIESRPSSGPRFTPRPAPAEDVAGYVSAAVASAPYRHQARILLHASAERAAAPELLDHLRALTDRLTRATRPRR